jgi:small subunit ribosomal protein S16
VLWPVCFSSFQRKHLSENTVMALKIRLTRIGAVHQPHYRVVVAEARSRRDGDPVDSIGTYDPRAKANGFKVDIARVDYWLSKGAKPTDTLHAMIKRARRAAPAAPVAAS